MLKELIEQLLTHTPLSSAQAKTAVAQLTDEGISAELKADFLSALAKKGETVQEIAAFAHELRSRSIRPPLDAETQSREILDVCGTGGDRLHTFNISTTVALVAAAAGITVAKHGNRAITSQAGSADVLQALGVKIELSPEEAAQSLRERGFAFFFAPKYHPAFKHIAPARKICAERGQRTIFNYLGPLLNPARPTAQLIGVPQPDLCEPIARVLQSLGARRGIVVCGHIKGNGSETRYLDELSTLGDSTIAEFYHERGFTCSLLAPGHFPLHPATLSDLRGSDAASNAKTVLNILRGEERGPKRDAILLNASAALLAAGKVKNLSEGWELAAELIDTGQALRKLQQLI